MVSTSPSVLRLLSVFLCVLFASGCDGLAAGDDSVTVRVTVQDVNTGAALPDAKVGLGYNNLVNYKWLEVAQTDARGQYVFELAECGRDTYLVNAFSARASDGGSYGPTQESFSCEPGDHSIMLRMAQY